MPAISNTFPFLIDLEGDEINDFLHRMQGVLASAKTNYDQVEELDNLVYEYKTLAEKRRKEADEQARLKATRELADLKNKLARYEEIIDRRDNRIEKMLKEAQTREDEMDRVRDIIRRENDRCVQVEPQHIASIIGWR